MHQTKNLSPNNSGKENAAALQALCDNGGLIEITEPGVYDLDRTVFLSSNTELVFGEGVTVRRVPAQDAGVETNYVLLNRGALTKTYDENITVRGMRLCCNGLEADCFRPTVQGLIGHLSFFYVKHLKISDFQCTDLLAGSFCIQICTFFDAVVEDVVIAGKKDGVHFGPGDGFAVRRGKFCTFDDPIALNAHDYAISNPQLGWIRNGVIEDCVDQNAESTVGFFVRLLAGSWGDWYEGMVIRNSDTVVSDGRMYRAAMHPDGKTFISHTRPTHTAGIVTLDGIDWAMVQDDNICYNCGCENITIRNISLQKKRDIAFCFLFDNDDWSHSYYPGSVLPVQRNITFQNITVENDIILFMYSRTPMENVRFIDCDLGTSQMELCDLEGSELEYPVADITFQNVRCQKPKIFRFISEKRPYEFK